MAANPAAPVYRRQTPTVIFPRRRKPRIWKWVLGIALALLAVILICARIAIKRAEPILRTRVIETLSTRFHSRVELATLQVWMDGGLHVEGKGLKIYGATDPNPWEPGVQPLLEIGEFHFATALRNLFREPMKVDTIFVNGLTMNIPPKRNRAEMKTLRRNGSKMSIAVDQFDCSDTRLLINTERSDKPPLEFDVSSLRLKDIGPRQPLRFDAKLLNPKPIGDIHSIGLFGPINEASPRDTAVQGTYSFTDADLSTLKGVAGILSSQGQYSGTLGRIEVKGETDTPDFRVARSGYPVPLHTDFHAIVDGTDGDTYLDPVKARVLNSSFTANGKVVRMKSKHGHDIELHVVLGRATIQDLLRLGVKTEPPVMSGSIGMTTELSLPPGRSEIADRLRLDGTFQVWGGHFSSEKLQKEVNGLSLRGTGRPKLLREAATLDVPSDLQGTFALRNGMLSFSSLKFQVPGTNADLTGEYSLDGTKFDFHGVLKTKAKLSEMTTGWKSILLKPVDPFFHKNGSGAEVPFKVTGTRSEPHFGLDFHRKAGIAIQGNPTVPPGKQ